MTTTFKVESGLQLLARLSKKRDIHKFYPILFGNGPKLGEVVEIFGDCGTGKSFLLMDLIIQALLPDRLGGAETEVIVFHTDGNMSTKNMFSILNEAIQRRIEANFKACEDKCEILDEIFQECCDRFHYIEIYDATQLYVTIHNLDNIFIDYPNTSLVVFDTLTAYYWSEQGSKLTKMDIYLKNIIKLIQKATKEHKSTIVYTRPEYFSSSKESIEHLEACCEIPTMECLNYRIYLYVEDYNHWVVIRSSESLKKRAFQINNCQLQWV